MVSLGTNDFLENYYATSRRSSQYKIEEYQDFLIRIAESFAREMYDLGARKMSLGGIAPMGCMPLERTVNVRDGGGCVEKYNRVAMEFNGKLEALAARLRAQLTGFRLVYSNIYDTVLQAIENPSTYGKSHSHLSSIMLLMTVQNVLKPNARNLQPVVFSNSMESDSYCSNNCQSH